MQNPFCGVVRWTAHEQMKKMLKAARTVLSKNDEASRTRTCYK